MTVRLFFAAFALLLLAGGGFFVAGAGGDADDTVTGQTKFYQYANGAGAGGYDLVAYFDESQARPGERAFETKYAGEVWRFASMENREKFLQNPRAYLPQYGGHCAYGLSQGYLVRGDPKAWSVIGEKLYLNYNKSVRNNWLANAQGFITQATPHWQRLNNK